MFRVWVLLTLLLILLLLVPKTVVTVVGHEGHLPQFAQQFGVVAVPHGFGDLLSLILTATC